MLSEFLAWWAGRMLELVPKSLRRAATPPDACVICADAPAGAVVPAVQLAMRRAGKETPLRRFVLDAAGEAEAQAILLPLARAHPVALRVPETLVLEREVVLPLAAEADLANLLRYDMERITPFTSDELCWTWAVTRRDRELRRIHVRISLVPKANLPISATVLERLQVAPAWLEAARGTGLPRVIPLGPMAASQLRRRRRLRLAVSATGGLAVVAIVLPFVLQSVARARVEAQLSALAPRVQLAEALRQRIAGYASGAALVAAEHGRVGDPLAVLAEVTTALPDDTFLSDLTLRQGRLGISGESKAAANLIGALAATKMIRNPAFVASVTRAENGSDAFAIRADIAR